jgi:hypothetical protein
MAIEAALDVLGVRELGTNNALRPNWRTFERQLPSTRNRTVTLIIDRTASIRLVFRNDSASFYEGINANNVSVGRHKI